MATRIEGSRQHPSRMRTCRSCGGAFDWVASSSSFSKLSYCSPDCEQAGRGHLLATDLHMAARVRPIYRQMFAA